MNSQVFDHTSFGQFIEKRFNVRVPGISPWHRAVCGDFTSAFDFIGTHRGAAFSVPTAAIVAEVEAASAKKPPIAPPSEAKLPQWEAGSRRSHALPYELHANIVPLKDGSVAFHFKSSGSQGAVFHVYNAHAPDHLPLRFTVEAGRTLAHRSPSIKLGADGLVDVKVFAPNGFFRSFKSDTPAGRQIASSGPRAFLSYSVPEKSVVLTLRNHTSEGVNAQIRWNAYRNDEPITVALAPNSVYERSWNIEPSGSWYDLSAKIDGFEWRFAGRMETGHELISDPAV